MYKMEFLSIMQLEKAMKLILLQRIQKQIRLALMAQSSLLTERVAKDRFIPQNVVILLPQNQFIVTPLKKHLKNQRTSLQIKQMKTDVNVAA